MERADRRAAGGRARWSSHLDLLASPFYESLLCTRAGRLLMLNLLFASEDGSEKVMFDALLAAIDDPDVRRLIRLHRDDEHRHVEMLRGCLRRLGVPPTPIPEQLRVVVWLDARAGACFRAFQAGDVGPMRSFILREAGIMRTYLLLQVLEERACRLFPLIAGAMRPHDRESAAVIERILRDEERHVGYSRAISRRYAPSEAAREEVLHRYRLAEARFFAEQSFALMQYAVAERLLDAGRAERLWWHATGLFGDALTRLLPAPYG